MKNLLLLFLLISGSLLFNACAPEDDTPIVMPDPDPEPDTDPEELDLPKAGLLAYFNFNENVNDQSGNENHGIVNGGEYVSDRDGAEEGAYKFELGDYITLPDDTQFSFGGKAPYSIGAFVKYEKLPEDLGRSIIISKFNGGVRASFYLGISDNEKAAAYRNSIPWGLESAWKVEQNTYTHIMSTYDGEVLRIYINGEESSSLPWNSHPGDVLTPTLIGATHSQGEILPRFIGEIDDLVIYDRALTETEIMNMVED